MKSENYRQAFDQFDPAKIALYDAAKVKADKILPNHDLAYVGGGL